MSSNSQNPTKIAIIGGGIAGLTAAHELVNRNQNLEIHVFEQSDSLGGFAKSKWTEDGFPIEHSWRGYFSFYKNLFRIMKEIPIPQKNGNNTNNQENTYNKTVYNNLVPVTANWYPFNSGTLDSTTAPVVPTTDFLDTVKIAGTYANALLSSDARVTDELDDQKWNELNLSKRAHNLYVKNTGFTLGAGSEASVASVSRFVDLALEHGSLEYYYMNNATSDAWFVPWEYYLRSKGVQFHFNRTLVDIKHDRKPKKKSCGGYDEGLVTTIAIGDNTSGEILEFFADYYIVAVPAAAISDIIPGAKKVADLGKHLMISAHFHLDRKVAVPHDSMRKPSKQPFSCYLPDSDWALCFESKSSTWNVSFEDKKFADYWSVTLTRPELIAERTGKSANEMTIEEILTETWNQIQDSAQLSQLVAAHNDFDLAEIKLVSAKIYDSFASVTNDDSSRMLVTSEPKWVNNVGTLKHFLPSYIGYGNLSLAGAHIQNTFGIWSMESAAETGIVAAQQAFDKLGLNEDLTLTVHRRPWYLRPFHGIDRILYELGMPSLLKCIGIVVAFVVVYLVLARIRMHMRI